MKELNLKTLFTIFITTLLISGCMPDSLTKWNADPPQLIEDPVVIPPTPITDLSYELTNFILSSDEDITIAPTVLGDAPVFAISGCLSALDLTCGQDMSSPTYELAQGLSFSTTTGTITGNITGTTLNTARYYMVTATNNATVSGAEPKAYFNISSYEPLSAENVSIQLKSGTKVILTTDNADAFEDTGTSSNQKRYLISENTGGIAYINYIDRTNEKPVIYAELTQNGVFQPGNSIDIGNSTYSSSKAIIEDVVIALESSLINSPSPFLTFTLNKGDGFWNATPLLPENRLLETRLAGDVIEYPSTLPVPDGTGSYTLTVKGVSDCKAPTADIDHDEQVLTCQSVVNSKLEATKYELTLSNPLMQSPDDYLKYEFKLSFSESPKYLGYTQSVILRVLNADLFNIGDIVSSSPENGDLHGVVVNVDKSTAPYGFHKLYVKLKHGTPKPDSSIGQSYPFQGAGVTKIISTAEAITASTALSVAAGSTVNIDSFTYYQGVAELANSAIADFNFNPRPFFLVDTATYQDTSIAPVSPATLTIHPGWKGQGYMVDAAFAYNSVQVAGQENLFFVPTEMTGAMDNETLADIPALNNFDNFAALESNYYKNSFRDYDNNSLALHATDKIFDVQVPDTTNSIAALKLSPLQVTVAPNCDATNTGSEVTIEPGNLAGLVTRCTGTDFNIKLDPYDLAGRVDTTNNLALVNPYAGGNVPSAVSLDKVFYVYNGEKATLNLFQGQGSNVSYSISPALPTGLFLNTSTGSIETINQGTTTEVKFTPGRYHYKLTAFNALGKIDYYFDIEVVSHIKITNGLAASTTSYITHQTGQMHQRRDCQITQAQIDNGVNQEILCYVDAGEDELSVNGVSFDLNVSKDLCHSIVYEPYFYHRDQYASVTQSYDVDASDGGDCTAGAGITGSLTNFPAAYKLYSGTDGSSFNLASNEDICDALMPGHRTKCGTATLTISKSVCTDSNGVTVPADNENSSETVIIKCSDAGYSYYNCLGGAGAGFIADNSSLSNDDDRFYSPIITGEKVSSFEGLHRRYSHKTKTSTTTGSNRRYANFTSSNGCGNGTYGYYDDNWAAYSYSTASQDAIISHGQVHPDGSFDPFGFMFPYSYLDNSTNGNIPVIATADNSNHFLSITDPFKLAQPFYTFSCLDEAQTQKARIRIMVRDWDLAFKAKDRIDELQGDPALMSEAGTEDDLQEWDTASTPSNLFPMSIQYQDTGSGTAVACSAGAPSPKPDIGGDADDFDYLLFDPTSNHDDSTGYYYGFPKYIDEPDYTALETVIEDLNAQ